MNSGLRRLGFGMFAFVLLFAGGCATQQTQVDQQRLHRAGMINAQLGIDYMNSGNLQRAHDKLKLALSQYPDSATIRYAYALLMQRLGENAKAEENFRRAIQINPKESDAHNNFGVFLCDQKRYQEAQKQFKAALANPLYSTPQFAYANSGFCYINQGDQKNAKAAFEHALNVAPGFRSALYGLAKLAVDQGDWQSADKYLSNIKGQAYYWPPVLALCMKVKQHQGDLVGATQCARDLYRMFPNSPEAKALQNGGS
ncbi:type IV pilus biogenesis/stability protein PilW [Acidihalobacter prosperus]